VQVRGLYWKSIDHKGHIWFEAYFDEELNLLHGLQDEIATRLQKFLMHARALNPNFLKDGLYHEAHITADYPSEWGLGSSSTLISLIAQWAGIDAMELFFRSFTGSGYDIACAEANGPIAYTLIDGNKPKWNEVELGDFLQQRVYFVYLGQKQDIREGIKHYREQDKGGPALSELNSLLENYQLNPSRSELLLCLDKSEKLIGEALNLPLVKSELFHDFRGAVKSLGAWGGDFVMALATEPEFDTKSYFQEKAYATVFEAKEILIHSTHL